MNQVIEKLEIPDADILIYRALFRAKVMEPRVN